MGFRDISLLSREKVGFLQSITNTMGKGISQKVLQVGNPGLELGVSLLPVGVGVHGRVEKCTVMRAFQEVRVGWQPSCGN